MLAYLLSNVFLQMSDEDLKYWNEDTKPLSEIKVILYDQHVVVLQFKIHNILYIISLENYCV